MEAEAKNVVIFLSSLTASLSYCYFFSSKIPKGIYRFISLIPIFCIFTILPLRFSFVFTTGITVSFTTWLTNFKLLRFAFDLDQSPFHPSYSLLRFITVASLPIKTKTAASTNRSPLKLGFQMFIFALLARIVQNFDFDQKIVMVVYCGLLFLIIDIISALCSDLILFLTGLEFEPSSDEPYLATSLQNFWGRWNLMVTNTLRHTVYKPIRSVFSGYEWAPLAGVFASFLVSGLMHELMVYQMSRENPTWEMTSFFVLHGICVVVEMVVKRALGDGRRRLPDFVARLLTVGFVMATGFWLFFPPLMRSRVDVKILEEYTRVVDFVKTKISVF